MKRFGIAVLVFVMAVTLCACGKSDPESQAVGKWCSYAIGIDGQKMEVDSDFAVLELKKGGTGSFTFDGTRDVAWSISSADTLESGNKSMEVIVVNITTEEYGTQKLTFSPGSEGMMTFGESSFIYFEK